MYGCVNASNIFPIDINNKKHTNQLLQVPLGPETPQMSGIIYYLLFNIVDDEYLDNQQKIHKDYFHKLPTPTR